MNEPKKDVSPSQFAQILADKLKAENVSREEVMEYVNGNSIIPFYPPHSKDIKIPFRRAADKAHEILNQYYTKQVKEYLKKLFPKE